MSVDMFADWDAAYVLGSLSPVERRQFEDHLEVCRICAAGVTELAGMPGLLAQLSPADGLATLDDAQVKRTSQHTDLYPRLNGTVRRIRFRRRVVTALAAAAVLAAAIVIPITIVAGPPPTVSAQFTPLVTESISAQVSLTDKRWGTLVEVECRYADDATWPTPDPGGGWDYALFVTDQSGTTTRVAGWKAVAGADVRATGSLGADAATLVKAEIRAVPSGTVMLAADLG